MTPIFKAWIQNYADFLTMFIGTHNLANANRFVKYNYVFI